MLKEITTDSKQQMSIESKEHSSVFRGKIEISFDYLL